MEFFMYMLRSFKDVLRFIRALWSSDPETRRQAFRHLTVLHPEAEAEEKEAEREH